MTVDVRPSHLSVPCPCSGASSHRPCVLVVDDEPEVRTVVSRCLESVGYDVRLAGHGREALELIASARPEVVLLDLQMPVMDGWELLDELNRRRLALPVVCITAGSVSRAETRRFGITGWVTKPFNLDDLFCAVAVALQRSESLDAQVSQQLAESHSLP